MLTLSSQEARDYFLDPSRYCTIDLPQYFDFETLLTDTSKVLSQKSLKALRKKPPAKSTDVNYGVLTNKDGAFAWRQLDLIHPALYVELVKTITEPKHWKHIRRAFARFQRFNGAEIECASIPVVSLPNEQNDAAQTSHWWQTVEQPSIQLALEYGFIIHTDIIDCYPSIYTHSISWALHGKSVAKAKRFDHALLGNAIDELIRDMRSGQTNGIPQGSTLMDFVAEIVLGYADCRLKSKLDSHCINGYKILRYRDDYRIFVNNPEDGRLILRCLTEVASELGMKLHPGKTDVSSEVVRSSIKADKLAYLFRKEDDEDLQKTLLIIHDHASRYPNSGSLARALKGCYDIVSGTNDYSRPLVLISIVTDIAYRNPRTYNVSGAILSHLLDSLEDALEKVDVIEKIKRKFSHLPNTGHMEIWLQRISHPFNPEMKFDERLCKLVCGKNLSIWNNDWISSGALRNAVDPVNIVNREILRDMCPTVESDEIELFAYGYE